MAPERTVRPRPTRRARPVRTGVALLVAGHPEPSLVVTAVVAGLAVGAGMPGPAVAVLLVAVAAGQLSIGWMNDAVDARSGRDAHRTDKPLAVGQVLPRHVRVAAAASAGVAVLASLVLGAAGLLHIVAVSMGWAYDAGLKATRLSAVCYALAFGLLPGVVSVAAGLGAPAAWAAIAGISFGVGVHAANALPDLDDDRAAGVWGLPQRLGRRGSAALAVASLALGSTAALVGPWTAHDTGPPIPAVVALTLCGVGLLGYVVAVSRGRDVIAERLASAVGLVVVGAMAVSGSRLGG